MTTTTLNSFNTGSTSFAQRVLATDSTSGTRHGADSTLTHLVVRHGRTLEGANTQLRTAVQMVSAARSTTTSRRVRPL